MTYANNLPFSIVENEHFIKLFQKIRPSLKLPSRYELSVPLLNCEYNNIMTKSISLIKSSNALSIIIDGWSSRRNDGIVNLIVCTPTPIFFKSIYTKANSHTGEYMLQLVKIPISEFGAKNIVAVISDNGSDVKCMRKLIKEEFPHISTFGCAAHVLNLLLLDICKLNSINKVLNRSKEIVKEVKYSHKKSAKFREYSNYKFMLKMPAKTRWYSVINMLQSLQKGRNILIRMVCEDTAVKIENEENIAAITERNEKFWEKVDITINLLKPITDAIAVLEADKSSIAEVPEIWFKYKNSLASNPKLLTKREENTFSEIISKREKHILTKTHYIANLLHPRYLGKILNEEIHLKAMEFLEEILSKESINIRPYLEFNTREGRFKSQALWSNSGTENAIMWWKYFKGFEAYSKLADLAIKYLSIPPSSASIERNFSLMARIHSIDRINLTNDKIEKLSAIQHNSKLFESENIENYLEIISEVKNEIRDGDKDDECDINETFIEDFDFPTPCDDFDDKY